MLLKKTWYLLFYVAMKLLAIKQNEKLLISYAYCLIRMSFNEGYQFCDRVDQNTTVVDLVGSDSWFIFEALSVNHGGLCQPMTE